MNGLLRFVCFGLGASLASLALRGIGDGSVPDVRGRIKGGIRAWLTIVDAAGAARTEYDAFQSELRSEPTRQATSGQRRRRIALQTPG
jgi:hypothetical protein